MTMTKTKYYYKKYRCCCCCAGANLWWYYCLLLLIPIWMLLITTPTVVSGYFWTELSNNCPISHNPIITLYYNTTTKSYQQQQQQQFHQGTNEVVVEDFVGNNSTSSSTDVITTNNNNRMKHRHYFIRRQRKRKLDVGDNNMYTTYIDPNSIISEEDYVSHFGDKRSSIQLPSTIQVRECSCAHHNHHYKNSYYCLGQYDYCYVPTYNVYNIFYVPRCYNQSTVMTISLAVWRPILLLYFAITILLLVTPRGHRIVGGCISCCICSIFCRGAGGGENWVVSYLLQHNPGIVRQLLNEHYLSSLLNHQRRLQQQQQQTTTSTTNNRWYSNFRSIFFFFHSTTTTTPPLPTTTSELIIRTNEDNEDTRHINSNNQSMDPIVINEDHERANEYDNVQVHRHRSRSRREDSSRRSSSCKRHRIKNNVEYEIRTKRYYHPKQPTIRSDCTIKQQQVNQPDGMNSNPYDDDANNMDDNKDNQNYATTKEIGDGCSTMHSATCSICLFDIDRGTKIGNLPCYHLFHIDCLKRWVRRRNVCPLCLQPNVATRKQKQQEPTPCTTKR